MGLAIIIIIIFQVATLTKYDVIFCADMSRGTKSFRSSFALQGCVRVTLKNQKKSLFARSGFKKMAENHHWVCSVCNNC